jgi:hypothetical protein
MSSWAEEYERMKRERLAKEAALKNKNVGFAQSNKEKNSPQPVKVRFPLTKFLQANY